MDNKPKANPTRSKDEIYEDYMIFINKIRSTILAMTNKSAALKQSWLKENRVDPYTYLALSEYGVIKKTHPNEKGSNFYSWTYGNEDIGMDLARSVYDRTREQVKAVAMAKLERDKKEAQTTQQAEQETASPVFEPQGQSADDLVISPDNTQQEEPLPTHSPVMSNNEPQQAPPLVAAPLQQPKAAERKIAQHSYSGEMTPKNNIRGIIFQQQQLIMLQRMYISPGAVIRCNGLNLHRVSWISFQDLGEQEMLIEFMLDLITDPNTVPVNLAIASMKSKSQIAVENLMIAGIPHTLICFV